MARRSREQIVSVAGFRLKTSNLDKVLYPETGTTKADVLDYLARIAPVLIPQAAWRPVTRKRWPDGVGTADATKNPFFRKALEDSAPDWVPRAEIQHKDHANTYPLANNQAVLAWFGQVAALELHVPQWRFDGDLQPANPDRMVLDLDPGDGAGLEECAEVAKLCRAILDDMGLASVPVTSGSKGIHIYASLDGSYTAQQVSDVAHELARALEADHHDLVVSDMKKALRSGKVLVDWSQNNGAKTTVCPYSLRGRARPTVAAPRTWDEITAPGLQQLDYLEVLERVQEGIDPIADQGFSGPTSGTAPVDRLHTYRSMRDADKTPEPVPEEAPGESDGDPTFVIQEHHARNLHWDFRLEHSGVLVSWAVPKGPPLEPSINRLAVMTEDHPLSYGAFEGTIPKGEYGAGEVAIWDSGTCELEKWREGKEVIAVLTGRPDGGLGGIPRRFALIHTGKDNNNWLLHFMKEQPADGSATSKPAGKSRTTAKPADDVPEVPAPMLATAGTATGLDRDEDWAFEMKWDGIRVVVAISGGAVRLFSRNGHDITAQYPELAELASLVDEDAVLDGEIVALDGSHRPDFGLLQGRMNLDSQREIAKAADAIPVQLMLFDALRLGDRGLLDLEYSERRKHLFDAVRAGEFVQLPPAHLGSVDDAIAASRELRLEGIVAKTSRGTYRPGSRSRNWIKIKNEKHQEVVVIGWWRGSGSGGGGIGSLLVAVNDQGELAYAGRVGTGFSERQRKEIAGRLNRLERKTPPVDGIPAREQRDVVWVTPSQVAEVQFSERTGSGRLRHPVWRGWRPDKDASQVEWED